MEFSSRGFQRENVRPAATTSPAGPDNKKRPSSNKAVNKLKNAHPVSILGIILSVSLLILVIALLLGLSTKSSETSIVDKNRYQAVFLNGGQAYFGKVKTLNDRYIDLSDIYYISTNGQSGESTQANISLVKLGSELHCPQDRMVVNREQVLFWENLNDDGKVVNAIKQWQKENPNGQKCNNQTTQQQTPARNQSSSSQESSSSASSSSESSTGSNSSTSNNSSTSSNPTSNTQSPATGSTSPSSQPRNP